MLYFPKWLVSLILGVCALGVLLTLPNLFAAQTIDRLPSWVPKRQVSLGLDLRGGSSLLLQVDMKTVLSERFNNDADLLRTEFRNAKIGYTGAGFTNAGAGGLSFTLTDPQRLDDVRAIVKKADDEVDVTVANGADVTLTPNPVALQRATADTVARSIEIVRRRIDETGTKEPIIEREGQDRILLQLPGVENPEEVKIRIGQTAKLTFQMVDPSVTPEDAARGRVPAGDEALPMVDNRGGKGGGQLIVVKKRIMVGGDTLTDARLSFDQYGAPAVSFKFDSLGTRRFGDATRENVNKLFAIVLDRKVISAPRINEPILQGSGIITGSFTSQSAEELALLLRAGALPAPLTILEERTVGPGLGADSIHAGALASVVGVTLVVAFMVVFYGLFGLYADIALFFNLCLIMASLSLLGATLTLPGIAGIALTMGMAVDANVLIYERIREELRGGRSIISSLQAGFERAFGTILDSHVTTLVAGALMFWLGSGPVKGFAVTLSLGVITSLFSAILVTRLLIVTWVRRVKPKEIPI
jgi:preprotein translocase subunit SecD